MTTTATQTPLGVSGTRESLSIAGQWGPLFNLPNVAIHAHVLPNGKVLMWGRRDQPNGSLDPHECTPFVWDPASKTTALAPQPTLEDGTKINLFCSGHTFLPDGHLLVVGGHLVDGNGLSQSIIYNDEQNTWTPSGTMNAGRWYPTAITLPDGTALVSSGSHFIGNGAQSVINDVQQIWDSGKWNSIVNFIGLPLYPRLHVGPDGRVFMSGSLAQSYFLDPKSPAGVGTWTQLGNGRDGSRVNGSRDYAPAVMYDVGKIIFIGGGNDPVTHAPTNAAEVIDLTETTPAWHPVEPMKFPRRQHNATVLPDGTVLVTGGTRGGGGPNDGFNDLNPGQPVHTAELWDPPTGKWIELSDELVDRCYHATTVLLPDATVLSAGGGEYRPTSADIPNASKDSHRNAQIFQPPYLFKGPRPDILNAPVEVTYGQTFGVRTSQPEQIGLVSWVRLPSVTHSFDQNQRINFLTFSVEAGKLQVTTPPNPNVCPPGHYMLFLLNKTKVPSVASIINIRPATNVSRAHVPTMKLAAPASRSLIEELTTPAGRSPTEVQNEAIINADKGTFVEVGLTSTCPYGIAACWGGAYEALGRLEGIKFVRPIPNAEDSTAYVYLTEQGIPDVEKWPIQFANTANGAYVFRGVEVSLTGAIERRDGHFFLQGNNVRPAISLLPLQGSDKIQWNRTTRSPKALEEDEREAFHRLFDRCASPGRGFFQVEVIGPLKKVAGAFELYVRKFQEQQGL